MTRLSPRCRLPRALAFVLLGAWPLFGALAESAAPGQVLGDRKPAEVMTFHGAEWLERPDREKEEKPDDVINAMELKPGDVAVDMGCGTGYFARRMAKKVGPSGKVYGVDIQPEMLDLMKGLCAKEGITNVVPVLGAEDDPKLPKGAVDWMILVDVYHEFQNPKPMLAKMFESLKPTGKIALVEYRGEGDSAKHIKSEHRMSVKQVLSEWNPAGFELVDLQEFLPAQHLFIFQKRPDRGK
ncbi:MAG: class I SAM-dependent methyltransferase [Candidatus Hydrogenedentes bacterium]|nr:class I SAM-dependent methyltransferase [Candidatus Hydrogenedentota bacterium]